MLPPAAPIPDETLTAWNRELYWWWDLYNWQYLREALRRPVILLSDSRAQLGSWDLARRAISLARDHLARDPWAAVMETLRHEMAHQYADEVLRAGSERPHADAFRHACERLRVRVEEGLDPGGAAAATDPGRGVRNTILKLLSLATSPNEHEAQAAVKKARQLLLKYNIDQAELHPESPYAIRQVGEVRARHAAYESELAAILNDFFFVQIIWANGYDPRTLCRGRVLELYGTRFNLDMAEYVHRYVTGLLPALWEDYRAPRDLPRRGHRLSYYSGVLRGLHDKLRQQDRYFRTERALVWAGDPRLTEFFRHHHPHIAYQSHTRARVSATYLDGMRQGKEIVIHRPISTTGRHPRGMLPS